jgi:hypothetical protein
VLRLLPCAIAYFFEDAIDVGFSAQYPDHPNPGLVSQVIDAQILKSLDGPGSQVAESFPGKTLGRAGTITAALA